MYKRQATAALSDHHHLAKIKLTVTQGRKQLAAGFDKLGLSYLPAYANFFLVKFGKQAESLYQFLLHRGLIVRPVDNYGLPTYLRITVGKIRENQKLLHALTIFLQSTHIH